MALQGIAHKNLTDPQLHELKGASTAQLNQVPFADGEGGTSFQDLELDKISFEKQPLDNITPVVHPAPYTLDISAMSATTTKTMTDPTTLLEAGKDLKELGKAHNDLITAFLSLKTEHLAILATLNSLLTALKTLGFLEDAT